MPVVTVRPDSTISENYISSSGGSSHHGRTSDDSDSTYIIHNGSPAPGYLGLGLGNPSLPVGAVVKSLAVRVRCRSTDPAFSQVQLYNTTTGTQVCSGSYTVTWGTFSTITPATANVSYPVASLSDLAINTISSDMHIAELYADVTYVEQPEVTVSAPTGVITTINNPLVSWVNTLDSDGGTQTHYEVKVFTEAQYTAGGFDPSTSTPTTTSGIQLSPNLSWLIGIGLENTAYRAYVRIAQTVNSGQHWSDWDYVDFEIDQESPPAPDPSSKRRKSPIVFDFTWEPVSIPLMYTIQGNSYPYGTQEDEEERDSDYRYEAVTTSSNTVLSFTANVEMPIGILITEYRWDWGDGLVGYGASDIVHKYPVAAPETTVKLTVRDSNNNFWSISKLLNLRPASQSVILDNFVVVEED